MPIEPAQKDWESTTGSFPIPAGPGISAADTVDWTNSIAVRLAAAAAAVIFRPRVRLASFLPSSKTFGWKA